MGGHPRRTPYYGWVLMVVLGITTIISYGTTQYLFGVLVVPLDATFHWGRASISGAYALGLIIAGLLGVPIGSLVDRRRARLLLRFRPRPSWVCPFLLPPRRIPP